MRHKPKIEWICQEEIFEVITLVISFQGAINQDSLISETVKMFGYKATSYSIAEYVNKIVEKKIQEGTLLLSSNGMVQLNVEHT